MTASPISSLLWRSQRAYQIFGANTNVGKTIFSTLLCRGAQKLWVKKPVAYLKPVSTGPKNEADHCHIAQYAPDVTTATLYQYELPLSPHIAARLSTKPIVSDESLLTNCREWAADRAHQHNGWLFLETAGGVHSPAPSGTTQADLYMPLRMPCVLVGDSMLGGISQTLSAYESLRIRGYDVESVLIFHNQHYGNLEYLAEYLKDIPVVGLPRPPARRQNSEEDKVVMQHYYDQTASSPAVQTILQHLDSRHEARVASLEAMAQDAHEIIWFPFTQQSQQQPQDIMVIDSAHGDHFQTLRSGVRSNNNDGGVLQATFDGSASWWTQGLGHSNPSLSLAAAYAAGRYGHVMFAGSVHQPALALAKTLLAGLENPRLSRVFFSDNGSTGIEVAIKMALRATRLRYGPSSSSQAKAQMTRRAVGMLGLQGGYHGDTLGAMNSAEPCDFNQETDWYEGKGFWFNYPTILCVGGEWRVVVPGELEQHLGSGRSFGSLNDIFDLTSREARGEHIAYEGFIVKTLEKLHQKGSQFGGLIIEPVVLGAGGMALVDPLFQRTLVKVVRRSGNLLGATALSEKAEESSTTWSGLPVIFDEVFTGLYRLGSFTSSSLLGVHPDISVHAKLLTGGLVPLCTTLASENIFDAFSSAEKRDALLHGHSYTAHPVGCHVALESLRQMTAMERTGAWDWAKTQNWWPQSQQQPPSDELQKEKLSGCEKNRKNSIVWSFWPHDLVAGLSHLKGRVAGTWALGSVLAVHLTDGKSMGYSSNAAAGLRDAMMKGCMEGAWNVHCRVLGNVLYLMTGQKTRKIEVERVSKLLEDCLRAPR